jgi:hypothetical protein
MVPLSVADLVSLAGLPEPVTVGLGVALLTLRLIPISVRATAALVALFSGNKSRAERALRVLDATTPRGCRRRTPKGPS